MNFSYTISREKRLIAALVFSLILHSLLLFNWPAYRRMFSEKVRSNDIEVTYVKAKERLLVGISEAPAKKSAPLPELSAPQKLVSEEKPVTMPAKKSEASIPKKDAKAPVVIKKPSAAQLPKVETKQPVIPKIDAITSVDASVDLQGLRLIPPSYSQVVRDKIIDNLDTRRAGGEGDVFVRFIITSSGALKDISVIDERSTEDGVLRRAAFEAVKNSAPFPAFPEKVKISEISFTCQIAFSRK